MTGRGQQQQVIRRDINLEGQAGSAGFRSDNVPDWSELNLICNKKKKNGPTGFLTPLPSARAHFAVTLAWDAKMSYLVLRTDGLMRLRDTAYTESRQQRGILIRWSDHNTKLALTGSQP